MPTDEEVMPETSVEYVGPFEHHVVVVDGWSVPFLEMHPRNGGVVSLTLDNRYGIDIAVADADRIVSFIADCIAVALGYTCHPRPTEGVEWPLKRHPFSRMHAIGSVSAGASEESP